MTMRRRILPRPSRDWAYFLDFDGTLLDVADTPDGIHVDAALLQLVEHLHAACGGAMAVVSGRSISDLDIHLKQVRVPRAGQHGLERRDASGRLWLHPIAPDAKHRILQVLQPIIRRYPELLLEDKGLSIALHYRRIPNMAGYAHHVMRELVAETAPLLEVLRGKCVVEAKPAGVDKGTAVTEFLRESPFRGRCPVFIGDDVTDERAFAAVNKAQGISIRVGSGRTCAGHRLADVTAVRAWLAQMLEGMA